MLNWLFKKSGNKKTAKPQVLTRDEHPISRRNISRSALKVMYRLNDAGFESYLVGGGVRDLLLGSNPKDFDIATDARPEQVKKLFRNSRIIGRRFKIVHVRFGPEIIEVTTFRGHHDNASGQQAEQSESGMLVRDNVYGSLEDDAVRRDLTINALYYTTQDFSVHDYTGGMQDINDRIIRIIGDPDTRYKEDPVRILRVIRFAAKLGFDIEEKTAAAIQRQRTLLRDVSSARMFDEVNKVLISGHGLAAYTLLKQYGLFEILFPHASEYINSSEQYQQLIYETIVNTDKRVRSEKPVTPAFLYASLLWPQVQASIANQPNIPVYEAIQIAGSQAIEGQIPFTAVPKRFTIQMREIWDLQFRLKQRHGKRAQRLREHPRFRAAYDFVLLREQSGEDLEGLGNWWTRYQQSNSEHKDNLIEELEAPTRKRRPRRRKPREQ